MAFHWTCPYCDRDTTIGPDNFGRNNAALGVSNKEFVTPHFETKAIKCPNPTCNKITISASIRRYGLSKGATSGSYGLHETYLTFQLVPRSTAKPQPDYIPIPIRQDYEEACLISKDSPKAAATLFRRCLQGIIRDFWQLPKAKMGNLKQELEQIEEQMSPETWAAIDSIRSIGNIGAHMEKDINLIVEVDTQEAELLQSMIEMVIQDWYVLRHQRNERTKAVIELATKKAKQRKAKAIPSDDSNNKD